MRKSGQINSGGFTLLEMSLVIVIIGLIIGGIVAGQSMVRAAQLRNMLSEYDSYVKAIKEFQDKYNALPGDMSNATSIWTTAVTANGDGSGTIGASDTTGDVTDTAGSGGINGIGASGEWFLAWQHLSLAGFIAGNYPGTGTTTAVVGTNVPASKLSGAGWTINYYLNTSGNAGLWSDQYGHLLNFGGYVAGNYTEGAILTSSEALSIDQKLDDGMPGTGKVRAWRTNVLPNCSAAGSDTSQTTQTYSPITTAGQACALVFLLGF